MGGRVIGFWTVHIVVLFTYKSDFRGLHDIRARVHKSRNWGEMLLAPVHCCDVTKPLYLLSGELCTSPLHSNRLYVYTVCCRRGGQCFSLLRTLHTDVVGDSSGRSYVTEQGHNVPLLRTRALECNIKLCGIIEHSRYLNIQHYGNISPVAVYDGCGSVAFVYWLELKQYL